MKVHNPFLLVREESLYDLFEGNQILWKYEFAMETEGSLRKFGGGNALIRVYLKNKILETEFNFHTAC